MSALTYALPELPRRQRVLIRQVERVTGAARLREDYERAMAEGPDAFFARALHILDMRLRVDGQGLEQVPSQGPVLLVANHPFGIPDGLALSVLASRVRPDFQILINRALAADPRLAGRVLPIDFTGASGSARANAASGREAQRTLERGGAVAVFPAGGIATAGGGGFGRVRDLEWRRFPAKVAARTGATVLPVYFPGQNSRLFQVVSQVSPTLRVAMIIREANRRRGQPVVAVVGRPLAWEELARRSRDDATEAMRRAVFALAEGPAGL